MNGLIELVNVEFESMFFELNEEFELNVMIFDLSPLYYSVDLRSPSLTYLLFCFYLLSPG